MCIHMTWLCIFYHSIFCNHLIISYYICSIGKRSINEFYYMQWYYITQLSDKSQNIVEIVLSKAT